MGQGGAGAGEKGSSSGQSGPVMVKQGAICSAGRPLGGYPLGKTPKNRERAE